MRPACLQSREKPSQHAAGLERAHHLFGLLIGEKHAGLALDIGRVAARHHVRGHGRLELALAPEHHDRVEPVLGQFEEFG